MAHEYKHSRLSSPRSIRILYLLPSANFDSPIHCNLREVSLDDHVDYEALSYVWGAPASGNTIFVNGNHTLNVTPSCREALGYLRPKRGRHSRALWIDAVCIDQQKNQEGSTEERNHQVKLMGDVYSKAARVLVWLGPAESSTSRLFRMMKISSLLVSARVRLDHRPMRGFVQLMSNRLMKVLLDQGTVPHSLPSRHWHPSSEIEMNYSPLREPASGLDLDGNEFKRPGRAFVSLLRHRWWFRVWTIQEQVLARECEMLCGRFSVSFEAFATFMFADMESSLEGLHDATDGWFIGIHIPRASMLHFSRARSSVHPMTAQLCLESAFNLDTTIMLDKIYGLYALLKAHGIPLADPDYTMDPRAVFENVVWAWIQSRGNLNILQLAARPPEFAADFPSWVPPWHLGYDLMPYTHGSRIEGGKGHVTFSWGLVSCVGKIEPGPLASLPVHTPRKLVLRGQYLGKLDYIKSYRAHDDIGDEDWVEEGWRERAKVFRDWCMHIHNLLRNDGEDNFAESVVEMALTISISAFELLGPSEEVARRIADIRSWFDVIIHPLTGVLISNMGLHCEEFLQALERLRRGEEANENRSIAPSAAFIRSMINSLGLLGVILRAFCTLDNKMMAMTIHWAQVDDEVFLFPGSDCPFIVRKDKNSYRLVGPAYIHRFREPKEWPVNEDDLMDVTLI